MAALSGEKSRAAIMRDAFDAKHISSFIGGVLRGGIQTVAVSRLGKVASVEAWDGEDGKLPEEEPLDAYDDVEIDF